MKTFATQEKHTSKHDYEVYFLQGNSISIVACGEVIFPAHNDFFITLNQITFPVEEKLDTMYVPKHLLLQVKTKKKAEPTSNLRLIHANG
jgi:hypothetical protein